MGVVVPPVPWESVGAIWHGEEPVTVLPAGFAYERRDKGSPRGGGRLKPLSVTTHDVVRYFTEWVDIGEELKTFVDALAVAIAAGHRPPLEVQTRARVTGSNPGFGLSIAPETMTTISSWGATVDISVHSWPEATSQT